MSPFTMVVLIVFIVMTSVVLMVRMGGASNKDRRRIKALEDGQAAVQGQITRLSDRLAVLERIATDSRQDLADEIERLKD